jgi:hypothetical protein
MGFWQRSLFCFLLAYLSAATSIASICAPLKKDISLPPARIWSKSSEVPNGGTLGPVAGARVGLVGRTYHGQRSVAQMMYSLVCMFANVPSNLVEVVIVLDAGLEGNKLAKALLLTAESRNFTGLKISTEDMPPLETEKEKSMFVGRLEGSAGKDRSQFSNFIADRYSLAPVIGMFDVETCFQVRFV